MLTLRRYLSLCALLFWQGGFLFYALVAIPIGQQVLHDQIHLQAQITGATTDILNGAGVPALALLLWDTAATADACRRRLRLRGGAWAVLFVSLAALFALHFWLDRLGPLQTLPPTEQPTFWLVHNLYLAACVAQWLAGLVYLGLTVSAWRAADAATVPAIK